MAGPPIPLPWFREMCVVLVNAGASLAAPNKDGNTALHLASFMNQLNTMEVGG